MLVCCSSAELFATVGVSFKVDCIVIQKLFDSNHKVWGTRTSAPVMFNASDPDGQSVSQDCCRKSIERTRSNLQSNAICVLGVN